MERIYCLLIGYLLGMFQTAYFYGKAKGIDIRQHGSGNAGTTNTLRVLGRKAGLIVFLGDVLKCMLAIWIVGWIFGESHSDSIYLLKIYAAMGAILGHNFPFYLGFKGGKGIAATAGMVVALHWQFLPVAAVAFFSVFFITHYVSLGSLVLYTVFVIQLIISGQLGVYGMEQNLLIEMYAVGIFLAVMAFVKHRANIGRLIKGTESKTYLSKKKKEEATKKQA